jgi:hypothetical protein
MTSTLSRTLAVLAVATAVAACNQNQTQTASQPAPAQVPVAAAQPPAPLPAPPGPPPIPPSTELPVNMVDSVMLSRPQDAPDAVVIHVAGKAVSAGWTDFRLIEVPADPNADERIRIYTFVATSPETPDEKRDAQPVETEMRVDALPPQVRTIRVVSATNQVSVPVVR